MNCITKIPWILFAISSMLFAQNAFAQNKILEKEISIAFEDITLKESLKKLEQTADVSTAYNERDVENATISITFEKELLSEVLDALLANENLNYKLIGNTITIYKEEKKVQSPPPLPRKKASQKFTLSGYITDAESGETLIGASIYCDALGIGTSTNDYGFYSLTLPLGTYDVVFSYVGYSSITRKIDLNKNTDYSLALDYGNQLEEVIVSGEEQTERHANTQMSSHKISLEKMKSIPVLMGERDVLKVIQLMPGVQSGSEGSTGLYVRGGGPDQNLMLLDGVPVYNASHLFGFLSTFNGDAIKSVELIKGGFPARYGGRLSSIIDVRMKEGNMKKIQGDFTMGIISGRFNIEGPIKKDKTSFSFSGRRTWIDLLTTPIQRRANKSKKPQEFKSVNIYNLYDINAKINHKFSPKSRLYLSSYVGRDRLAFEGEDFFTEEEGNMIWGNKLLTARWNYQISQKLFANTTVYFSGYDFDFENEILEGSSVEIGSRDYFSSNSNISDYGAKLDLNFIPHPNHYIRGGLKYGLYQFTPTITQQELQEGQNPVVSNTNGGDEIQGHEISAYLENDMKLGQRIKLNAGIHVANFAVENSNYTSFQPRAALSFQMNQRSSLKASVTKMTQFLHLLASPGLGLPTDLWVSSTDRIKPENSWQYGLGYTQSLKRNFELTVEVYYKEMDNVLDYKSGFNFFSNSKGWEDKVEVGTGKSFGGEILLEKTKGKTTGWIGYTLSKSTRAFPTINFGKSFPSKYDRRHDIGLAVIHKPSDRVDFGLVWVYGTGNTYTLGTSNYNAIGFEPGPDVKGSFFRSQGTTSHIESRNNQRMPAYHRLDLSVNLHKEKKRISRTWSFGIYNVYARQNPFVVYSTTNADNVPVLEQQSLLPILPYFSYSFKF